MPAIAEKATTSPEIWHKPLGLGRFKFEQREKFVFAVLGPNPNAGKEGASYKGEYLTICTTDGLEEAIMIAGALNTYGPAQHWPAK